MMLSSNLIRHYAVGLTLLLLIFLTGCSGTTESQNDAFRLFDRLSSEESGVDFFNKVDNKEKFNIFTYRNFYNGGGVAIGDINNDGFSDIYFTANDGPNKLFLNEGDFSFKDISASANIQGTKTWSTGVAMVDINADGLLDIYVCNAGYNEDGDQENELFVNNGDLTFTESAEQYGLADNSLTTHAAFFDYDLDGDLDVYILNNSFIPVNTLNYQNKRTLYAEDWDVRDFVKGGGDKLLRNDDGYFNDVTKEAGIYGSLIGFGLGITAGDINEDNLPDIYISNDFFEHDYLYINQGDGTFKEELKERMQHSSLASMGADMADINNDGHPEVFVTEMLPSTDKQIKTKSLFDGYNVYNLKVKRDFHHQYMHNTLQLNNNDGSFSEVAWYSGVAASDWSWGALMFDANNNSYRDIYVCNGIYQDITDQDFMDFFANDVVRTMMRTGVKEEKETILKKVPSNPQPNKFFVNNGDLTFSAEETEAGLATPSFSNGAAYGDLDNDGDLDLVVNNLNQDAFVYRNNSEQNENHYLKVEIRGAGQNTFAVGAKVLLHTGNGIQYNQLIPNRGFQSSVDLPIVFGLGGNPRIDSLEIIWPDQSQSVIKNVPIDTTFTVDINDVSFTDLPEKKSVDIDQTIFSQVSNGISSHKEDDYVDFYNEGLVIRMLSKEGPKVAKADLDGDGLDDLVMGGASGQETTVYFQSGNGFQSARTVTLERSGQFEDTAIELFDADGDNDLDIFVGSGGNNRRPGSPQLEDRLYINEGKNRFTWKPRVFASEGVNTATAVALDYDGDGDQDLFVGSRSVPLAYGLVPRSYLYENDGKGNFRDITSRRATDLKDIGMVTSAVLSDIDGDNIKELIVTGEWMATKVFKVANRQLTLVPTNLDEYPGWWYSLNSADVNGDGLMDLVMGNRGENFYFTANSSEPAKLWVHDFDNNGAVEKVMTRTIEGKDMPLTLKKELTDQVPALKKQNLKHTEYADKSIQELFDETVLSQAMVHPATYFKSAVAINNGDNTFTLQELPTSVQLSNVSAIYTGDLNDDGAIDLVLGGNFSGFTPQYSKLDASFGQVLLNQGDGTFTAVSSRESGLKISGDIKEIIPIEIGKEPHLLITVNNQKPVLLKKKLWLGE